MKEIQLSGSTYFLVGVAEANRKYRKVIDGKYLEYEVFPLRAIYWEDLPEPLPPGQWEIVGVASELTEDQWKGIVEKIKGGYECYDLLIIGAPYSPMDTAIQSGKSLLTHHGYEFSKTLILVKQ